MKKTIFLLMAVSLPFFMLTSCSKDDDDDNGGSGSPAWNNPGKLSVTGSVTDITAIGATISGWANIDPALAMAAKFGVIVSEDPKPSYSNGMLYSSNELNLDNSYQVEVTDLTPGTKYYYLSYVRIGDIYTYGEVRSFSTKEVHSCPDKRHPHAIDLGLPSGTKWACCNVGATTPEGYGGYYAWGETSEKDDYHYGTYKWCNGSYRSLTKYCTDSYYGSVDGKTVLDLSDDVAHVRMGGSWRMPTYEQTKELEDNCTETWTQQNGVNGILVTGPSGGQIFLPAAGYRQNDYLSSEGSRGYYWSSSLSPVYGDIYACYLDFRSGYWYWGIGHDGRDCGLSVRAVCP